MKNGLRKMCAVLAAVMLSTNIFSSVSFAESGDFSLVEAEAFESTEVKTAEELLKMKADGVYHLANDIDLSGVEWRSVRNFKGVFDGNGFEIKNLESTTYGLFAELKSNAVVKNVRLTNVKIMSKFKIVGGIAAIINGSEKNVRIDNCYVSGVVASCLKKYKKPSDGSTAGAIVGKNNSVSSVISNCYSNALVCAERQVGGIVGVNRGSVINCGFGGVIENSQNVWELVVGKYGQKTEAYIYLYCCGGICGFNYGTVQNCLSNYDDRATGRYTGGIVGANMKNSKILNCVNLAKVSYNDMYCGLIAGNASKKSEITNCYTIETDTSFIGQTAGRFDIEFIAESELSDGKLLKKLGDEWCMENNLPAPASIKDYTLTYRLYDVKAEMICPAITGWYRAADGWRYHDEKTGIMSVGKVKINGKNYTFSRNGIWNGKADYDNTKIYSKLTKELSKDDYGGIYLDKNAVIILSKNNNKNVKKLAEELRSLFSPIVVYRCRYSVNELEEVRTYLEKNRKRYGISAISTDIKNNRINIEMKKSNSSLNAYLNAVGNDMVSILYTDVLLTDD